MRVARLRVRLKGSREAPYALIHGTPPAPARDRQQDVAKFMRGCLDRAIAGDALHGAVLLGFTPRGQVASYWYIADMPFGQDMLASIAYSALTAENGKLKAIDRLEPDDDPAA